ncbi:MAG: penicillin-binding transpeptidase domain-containing protein [Firmicutes bacterium]|nr:penicillin-binding transpeptidase domain-containing protein [Bacillota bacterium]
MNKASKRIRELPGRGLALLILCLAVWCAIIIRLIKLQIIDYDKYLSLVIDNIQIETSVTAERGIIYDRNMIQLATNNTVWRVFISPGTIADMEQAKLIASGLSEILGVEYSDVIERAQKTWRLDETIKRNVEDEKADEVREFIKENNLEKQIYLQASSARYYPFGSLAAQTIGVVGTDGGLIGLELQYDSFLTGVSGRYISAKNARGLSMPYKYDTYIDASNGANIVSTLDVTMQLALEKQLKQTYEDSSPLNRVTGIAIDVNTGAIRAMGTYPDFDLNSPYVLDKDSQYKLDNCGYAAGSAEYNTMYQNLLYSLWKNKAVSELYEPGSTFKVITTGMCLEENVIKWDDQFFCSANGLVVIPGVSPVHCHKRSGHGLVTYRVGLQQSCNPTLMQAAARLGREKFYNYFKAFGYTEKSGVDLPGEATPYYHSYNNFNALELAVCSFGQTFKVTALQQITAISAVANGGNLLTPYLVEQIIDDNGNVLYQHETEIRRQVISSEVCSSIAEVLEEGVAGNGGAKNTYVPGYKIAAKTGTSEVRDILDENGQSYLRVGSTVAFAPSDDPQIAVIIVVDQPQCESVYGSIVAAPYVAKYLEEILPYLGVERNYSEEELAKLSVSVKNYVGWPVKDATLDIGNRKINYEVKGDGDIVTYQIPASGNTINKETGKIIIYTGSAEPEADIEVPKVTGMTSSNANRTLVNAGLNVVFEGATQSAEGAVAYVTEQSPAPGSLVTYGTVVTVTLRFLDGTAN